MIDDLEKQMSVHETIMRVYRNMKVPCTARLF